MGYTVYKHTTPSNKVYIGITSQRVKKRWQNGRGYITNDHFYRAIKKYGWDNIKHEILYTDLSKEDACRIEIDLIKQYNSTDYRCGYNNARGGQLGTSKPIDVYSLDGELLGQYENMSDAIVSLKLEVDDYDSMKMCCRGKTNASHGYVWRFAGDPFDKYFQDGIRLACEYTKDNKTLFKVRNKNFLRKINQYSKTGELINTYKDMYSIDPVKFVNSDKAKDTNKFRGQIYKACNPNDLDKLSAYGYIWRLDGDSFDIKPIKRSCPTLKKKIIQYTKDWEFVKEWESIIDAQLAYNNNNIGEVIRGNRKTASGYRWTYA